MKSMLVRSIFTVLVLVGNLSADTLNGIWEGNGAQNGGTSWKIQLIIVDDQYAINYPTLSCGGKLTFISKEKNKISFTESLTYGKHNCTDKGTVIIKKVEDDMLFEWFNKNVKQATGVLSRN